MNLSRWMLVSCGAVVAACDHELTTVDVFVGCGCVVREVTVAPASVKLVVGDTFRLSATSNPPGAAHVWSSRQPAVADVDSLTGLVTAKSVGTATIVASRVQDLNLKGASAIEVSARPQ